MPDNNKSADSTPDTRTGNRAENQPQDKPACAAESKRSKWFLFSGAGKATEAEKRLQRLEELRRDLYGENSALGEYAVNTLFTMLWIETASERLAVACALSDSLPLPDKGDASPFAARLCYRVQAPAADPLAVPPLSPLLPPKGAKLREWAEQTLLAIFTDALNTIKLMLRQTPPAAANALYVETDVCHAALRLAPRLKSPALVEATLRLLRMFPPDLARETGPFGRQTPELRSLASLYLAALSPDDLYPLWVGLNGSDANLRQSLLPVLDYLNDPRVVSYLIKMLERHSQWADGDLAAWAAVRALQRLRDRRALPVLRRLVAMSERAAATASPTRATSALNPALIQAARRAIESIEHQRQPKEHSFLLRPSQPDTTRLLRPAESIPDSDANHAELLRSDGEEEEKRRRGEEETGKQGN